MAKPLAYITTEISSGVTKVLHTVGINTLSLSLLKVLGKMHTDNLVYTWEQGAKSTVTNKCWQFSKASGYLLKLCFLLLS